MNKKGEVEKSLNKLSKKIDYIKEKEEFNNNKSKIAYTGLTHAFRIVSELFANVLVGGCIGWTLDYFLETKPIFLIIFLIIGIISGIYTSYKSSKKWQV
tara:strand:- start:8506 stop:8802 length:297 start_codon:yes stop_codon:yes gene_type:complete